MNHLTITEGNILHICADVKKKNKKISFFVKIGVSIPRIDSSNQFTFLFATHKYTTTLMVKEIIPQFLRAPMNLSPSPFHGSTSLLSTLLRDSERSRTVTVLPRTECARHEVSLSKDGEEETGGE